MFIFLRLFLAHLIGDFPLQTHAIYAHKVKSRAGPLMHVLIVTSVMMILTLPFLHSPWMWLILAVNSIGHYIQDWAKLAILQKMENKNNFWIFIIDQIFHILSASAVFLTPLESSQGCPDTSGLLCRLYGNNELVSMLIGWVLCGFAGTFLIACMKDTFFPAKFHTPFLEPVDRVYGLMERTLFFLLLNQSMVYVFLLPVFIFFKFLFANSQVKRLNVKHAGYIVDTLLGFVLSGLAVLASKAWA